MLAGGPRKISPFFIPGSIVNLAAGHVSIRFKARGTKRGYGQQPAPPAHTPSAMPIASFNVATPT